MMKEKAMPVKRQRRSAKGTVLFTVVSVMMVLIVFLMGTLALAATANNRAYKNYQKAQTEATARAVLDSVVEAINTDTSTNGLKARVANTKSTDAAWTVDVTVGGEKSTVTVSHAGTQQYYDETSQTWKDANIYRLSTNVSKTMADTTYDTYIIAGGGKKTNTVNSNGGAFVAVGGVEGGQIGTQGQVLGGSELSVSQFVDEISLTNDGITQAPFYANGNVSISANTYLEFANLGDFIIVEGNLTWPNGTHIQYNPSLKVNWNNQTQVDYNKVPYVYVGGYLNNTTNNRATFNDPDNSANDVAINVFAGGVNIKSGIQLYGDLYCFDEGKTNLLEDSGYKNELYQWTKKTITNSSGTDYSNVWGNFYAKGATELAAYNNPISIGGDLRVTNNVTVKGSKGVTVGTSSATEKHGNVVVNGTLKVESGATLTATGNIICGTLINEGKIDCGGIIKTVNPDTTGDLSGKTAQTITGLTPIKSTTETVTTKTYYTAANQDDGAPSFNMSYNWNSTECYISGTYRKHVVRNGVESHTDHWSENIGLGTYPNDASYSNLEDLFKAICPEYKEIIDHIGEANAITEDSDNVIAEYDLKTVFGESVYPDDYTSDNLDDKLLSRPQSTDYSGYPMTLQDLNTTLTNSIYATDVNGNPDYNNFLLTSDGYDQATGVVTKSCVVTAKPATTNLYINPDPNLDEIVVYLNGNFSFGQDDGKGHEAIVINDNVCPVYIFLNGSLWVVGGFLTTDYVDHLLGHTDSTNANYATWTSDNYYTSTDFGSIRTSMVSDFVLDQKVSDATDWRYPNVVLYSTDGSSLTMGDNSGAFETINVRAPGLAFKQSATNDGPNKTVTYKQATDFGTVSNTITYCTLVGQLIAKTIDVPNQWGMAYVTVADAPEDCTCTGCNGGAGCGHKTNEECTCTCADCKCKHAGGGGSGSLPAKFNTIYYNIY